MNDLTLRDPAFIATDIVVVEQPPQAVPEITSAIVSE